MTEPWPVPPLRVQLLHQPMLAPPAQQGQPLQRKDAALLAMLALQGPTPRAKLTAMLWPDASETGAHNNLRQRLFRLRRAAGRDVVVQAATLHFATAVTHDLLSVTEALRRDPQGAQGELLGGLDYGDSGALADWVATQRQRWRAMLQAEMLGLALGFERSGQHAQARPYARRLTLQDPADEAAAQLLIRLLIAGGERDAALTEFDRCVLALRDQQGRAPSGETVALARLVGRSLPTAHAAPTPLALALRHPPRTVGREAVFQAAERCWQAHHVVLLTGPAGIGKTRVLDELASRWRVGIHLKASPDDSSQPHGLLKRLVAALLPHIGGTVSDDDQAWLRWIGGLPEQAHPAAQRLPQRLAPVLLNKALAAAAAQGVQGIAIDDLHHACAGSLAALCAVLPGSRRLHAPDGAATAPMHWLLATRDGHLPGPLPGAAQTWLAEIDGGFDPVVPLLPLQRQHIAELLATVSPNGVDVQAWAERLEQHCTGHPLLLLQVLRELHDKQPQLEATPPATLPMPAETRSMFARRLGQVDALTQRLACVAAVCGHDFNAEMAARLLRCSATELLQPWQQLQAMHILHDQGLDHELVRDAVLSTVPAPVAALLHVEVARALQDSPGCSSRRARHWEAGGAFAQAAADHTSAADDALARGLQTQAIDLLRHAARNHRQAGQAAEAALCDWRAGHLVLANVSATDAMAVARGLIDAAQSPVQTVRGLELLARAKCEQHDSSALRDAELAHTLATETGDAALIALTQLCLAGAWMLLGRHAEALVVLVALQVQPGLLAPQQRCECADMHSVTLSHLGRRAESVQVSRLALAAATDRNDLAAAAGCAGNIAVQLSYLGQVEASVQMYQQAIDLGHRAGTERGFVLVDEMGLAGNHADMGRYATALGMYPRLVDGLREAGYTAWAMNAENDWALTWLRLGRADLAHRLLTDLPEGTPAWSRAARRMAQARLLQWRGEPSLAVVQQAAQLLGQGGAIGDAYVRERIELEVARSTSPDAAAARALLAMRWAKRHQHTAFGRLAGMVRTAALVQLGRGAQAARAAGALGSGFDDGWQAFGFYLPELWLVLCDAHAAGGQHDQARALAAHGVSWLHARLAHDVPAPHRDSFVHRNPFNSRLLRWPTP